MPNIDPLSVIPLYVECAYQQMNLGAATAFCVRHEGKAYLITNWHVVTGLNPQTNQPHRVDGATPDALLVWHHVTGHLGHWRAIRTPLYDVNGAVWREHPEPRGQRIDVVAVPLSDTQGLDIYPLDLALANTDLIVSPSEAVSIIGFPLGFAVNGKLPIWKTGHIASDIDIDYDGKPAFLIDATTTGGMSGSPVRARRTGGYRSSEAVLTLNTDMVNRFMGVYSGRIHGDSDVGLVWKPLILEQILTGAAESV